MRAIATGRAMVYLDGPALGSRPSHRPAKGAIEAVIRRIMPLAQQFHFLLSLWEVAESDEEVRAVYNRQLSQLATLVNEMRSEGVIAPSMSTTWVVTLIDAQLAAAWWMVGQEEFTVEQAAEAVVRSVFDGISGAR